MFEYLFYRLIGGAKAETQIIWFPTHISELDQVINHVDVDVDVDVDIDVYVHAHVHVHVHIDLILYFLYIFIQCNNVLTKFEPELGKRIKLNMFKIFTFPYYLEKNIKHKFL